MKLFFSVHLKLLITLSLITLGIGCISPEPETRARGDQGGKPTRPAGDPDTKPNPNSNGKPNDPLYNSSSDDSDELEPLEDELSDLDEASDPQEDLKKNKPLSISPLGKKLDFQVVSPLASDATKPDPVAPLPLQLIFGNAVTKIQVPIVPKHIPMGRNFSAPLNLWPFFILSDHCDKDPIISANYVYEVIDSKNQTHSLQKPASATPDYGNKLWYISTEDLNQALSRAAFTATLSDTHLLRLDLVMGSGSRKLLDVRFKMKSQ